MKTNTLNAIGAVCLKGQSYRREKSGSYTYVSDPVLIIPATEVKPLYSSLALRTTCHNLAIVYIVIIII